MCGFCNVCVCVCVGFVMSVCVCVCAEKLALMVPVPGSLPAQLSAIRGECTHNTNTEDGGSWDTVLGKSNLRFLQTLLTEERKSNASLHSISTPPCFLLPHSSVTLGSE